MSITRVGRRYHFRAIHQLPESFGVPWCYPHEHTYTIEVEAEGGTSTDALDERWAERSVSLDGSRHLLDTLFEPSTVENVAEGILGWFDDLAVLKVTVWEDQSRWGTATRPNPGIGRIDHAVEVVRSPGPLATADMPFIG